MKKIIVLFLFLFFTFGCGMRSYISYYPPNFMENAGYLIVAHEEEPKKCEITKRYINYLQYHCKHGEDEACNDLEKLMKKIWGY